MAGAIVQSAFAVDDSGANATTLAAVLNSVVAGNHLVAHVGYTDAASTSATFSDGTSYSVADAERFDATEGQSGTVFYLENAGSGTHTGTATFSPTTSFRRNRYIEVSGLATSSSLDKDIGQVQTAPGTGANAISSSASAATANANDFVMGFTQDAGNASPGSGTLTAGTGYTISGTNVTMGLESKSVSVTGAQTSTFTQSVAAPRITHVVAFKELSGATSSSWARAQSPRFGPRGPAFPAFTSFAPSVVPLAISIDTAGSVALAGQSFTSNIGVAVANGSVTLAGQTVTTNIGTAISNGAVTLAGQSVASNLGVAVANGAVTIAGQSVTTNIGVATTNGQVTLAGQDVTISLPINLTVDIDAGQITMLGQLVTAAIASGQQQSTSGGFFYDIDHFRSRKRAERDRLARHESDTAQLEQMEREIAELLRDQERKDIERDELRRIQRLADDYSGRNLGLPRRVSASLLKAYEERSRNALEQLQRELDRMLEEEEVALMLLLNDD